MQESNEVLYFPGRAIYPSGYGLMVKKYEDLGIDAEIQKHTLPEGTSDKVEQLLEELRMLLNAESCALRCTSMGVTGCNYSVDITNGYHF